MTEEERTVIYQCLEEMIEGHYAVMRALLKLQRVLERKKAG